MGSYFKIYAHPTDYFIPADQGFAMNLNTAQDSGSVNRPIARRVF